jgi:Holliday junction resolvasome RuvABC endonuclease subunit
MLGIDPGREGALAFLDCTTYNLSVYEMPQIDIGISKPIWVPDGKAIATLIKKHRPTHALLENVFSSSQMGVMSAFSFGCGKGVIMGAVTASGIDCDLVSPSVWKIAMKAPADKKLSVNRAKTLFPACVDLIGNDDGIAEAAMIGLYGLLQLKFEIKRGFTPCVLSI